MRISDDIMMKFHFKETKIMKLQKPMLAKENGVDMKTLPQIPFVGDEPIKGWREVDSLFVDSSGFGQRGEAALTVGQFIEQIKIGFGYGVIEARQFQVYVGVFERRL